MNVFRCTNCDNKNISERDIILTISNDGEEVLHCPKCYDVSLVLEEYYPSANPSPHSLQTYYGLDIDYDYETGGDNAKE